MLSDPIFYHYNKYVDNSSSKKPKITFLNVVFVLLFISFCYNIYLVDKTNDYNDKKYWTTIIGKQDSLITKQQPGKDIIFYYISYTDNNKIKHTEKVSYERASQFKKDSPICFIKSTQKKDNLVWILCLNWVILFFIAMIDLFPKSKIK